MHNSSLITVLKDSGFLSTVQYEQVVNIMNRQSLSPQQALAELPTMDTSRLAVHCATLFHLSKSEIQVPACRELIKTLQLQSLCQEWLAIPIEKQGQWLTLGISDPTRQGVFEAFQFATGLNIDLTICDISSILSITGKEHQPQLQDPPVHPYQIEAELNASVADDEQQSAGDEAHSHATPIGQFVHQIIISALKQRASDIHFEPYEHHYRIRMRIDGLLVTTHTPAKKLSRRLASRIKILAHLNIAEKRLPQDGRLKIKPDNQQDVDIRVSTLPTLWGEKIVLRILGTSDNALTLPQLGMTPYQLEKFLQCLNRPQGLILITGPTGSGKTTTLYSALQQLNQEQRNISTVEDPIEIQLSGINQIQIHDQIGLSFAPVLRSLLRQDPDVIMLGEIRDQETAQMAIRAAQTGHLVLSTLHTNSAPEALSRLQQMDIPDYQLVPSLHLVIAQRLVRKLCPDCKIPVSGTMHLDPSGDRYSQWFQANNQGCPHCLRGYKGRAAVYDMFTPGDNNLTASPDTAGFRGCLLWQHALELLDLGITSYSEISRVIRLPEQFHSLSTADNLTQYEDH